MTSFPVPSIRRVIYCSFQFLRVTQRRWAQVHDIRYLVTQQPDRVLEKYREKLERKAREHGLQDARELREMYKGKIEALKKKAAVAIPLPISPLSSVATSNSSSPFPSPPPPPVPLETSSASGLKTLSSYLDLEKVRALPVKEIETIWRLRHIENPQSLCAVIPISVYHKLEATAKKHPSFILPIPKKGQGAEIHFLQWAFPAVNTVTVLFTHLAEYKLRGEFSQPHTTITHHLELASENGVVLLKGDVVEGRGVSLEEAKWLVMCLQNFYGSLGGDEGNERRRLLELFGNGSDEFRVEDLVEEAEKVV